MATQAAEPSSSRQGNSSQNEDEYAFDVPDEDEEDDDLDSPMAESKEKVRFKNPFPNPPVIELRGREVIFAIAVFFLLSACIGLIIVMASAKNELSGMLDEDGAECVKKECLFTAARIMEYMKPEVKPCQDFWQYACGGWLEKNDIPPGHSQWGVDNEVVKRVNENTRELVVNKIENDTPHSAERKVKTLYRKCMDVDAIDKLGATPLVTIMDKLGGWAIRNDFNAGRWSFQTALEDLHYVYWADVFFTFWVSPDDMASHRNVLHFDQQGLGMDKSYYTQNDSHPMVVAYRRFMRDIARLFNATEADVTEFVDIVFEFERQLADIMVSETSPQRQSPEAMYNRVTTKELQQLAPSIDWTHFLQRYFTNITDSTAVIVASKVYMSGISDLIQRSSDRVLNLYMMWRLAANFAVDLSKPFRVVNREFENAKSGTEGSKERWRYCMQVVNDWMGNAVGSMFVHKYFPRESRDHVTTMIGNIRDVFLKRLRKNEWMDDVTSEAAEAKLDAMVYKIGYPDFLANESRVNDYYSEMTVEANDTYFQLQLNGIRFDLLKMMADYESQITRKEDWGMNPHEVNAYYAPTQNLMVFPAGILQLPYFEENVPQYVNYGGIGSTIGHELTHGFDVFGSRYDGKGTMVEWWSEQSWSRFENRTSCIAEYYSDLSIDGMHVDGMLTLGENIADIGGLLQTYYAYRHLAEKRNRPEDRLPGINLDPYKLFFIAYAQNWCNKHRKESLADTLLSNSHAPAEIRVMGTLSQMEEFAQAFNCPVGSRMNPSNKCSVW